MSIIEQKIRQAHDLLNEFDLDLWLIYVRETSVIEDPLMPLLVGHEVVWPSFFIYSKQGDAIAIVGSLDQNDFERSGHFTEVIPFTRDSKDVFLSVIDRLKPSRIAINYSRNTPSCDGLTHGMYLTLQELFSEYLKDIETVSSEPVAMRLRSRKSEEEIKRIQAAAGLTTAAWDAAIPRFKCGMSEIEIGEIIDAEIKKLGALNSFDTIVNAGSKTRPGHGHPTQAILEPGDLLHVDFGARLDDYCADLQRLIYFRKEGQDTPPAELLRAFDTIRDIITASSGIAIPGNRGCDIDAAARQMLTDNGFEVYQHALGHQLGRFVHDGGALLGPIWEQYGVMPVVPLEPGNVFTLELEIMLDNIGCVGLEEDVAVESSGARFLCPRQEELIVL